MKQNYFVFAICVSGIVGLASLCKAEEPVMYRMAAADSEHVWMATNHGLACYDKQSGEITEIPSDTYNDLLSVGVAGDGTVTVGANLTAGIADYADGSFSPVKTGVSGLQNVHSLLYADGLWVGASQMLVHQSGEKWEMIEGPNPFAASYLVDALAYDATSKRLWFGAASTAPDKKLGYIDEEGEMTCIDGSTMDINGIYVKESGTAVLATKVGMLKCEDGVLSPFEHPISSISPDCKAVTGSGENIWFAGGTTLVRGEGTSFKSFNCRNAEEPEDYITSLVADGDVLWFTMAYGGLYCLKDNVIQRPTGISSVISDIEEGDDALYDLNGCRIQSAAKGQVYICGGKKYIGK